MARGHIEFCRGVRPENGVASTRQDIHTGREYIFALGLKNFF